MQESKTHAALSRWPRRDMTPRAVVFALAIAACAPAASPAPPPSISPNMAELHPDKVDPALRKRWLGGLLRPDETGEVIVRGTLDDRAVALMRALGGRTVRSDASAMVVELPNEALQFLVLQPWLTSVAIAEGAPPLRKWVPTPVDTSKLPAEVRAKMAGELQSRFTDPNRGYTLSGSVTATGCIDDARRAELVASGFALGLVTADPGCARSRISFMAPAVTVPLAAALPWVVAIEVEPRSEPN